VCVLVGGKVIQIIVDHQGQVWTPGGTLRTYKCLPTCLEGEGGVLVWVGWVDDWLVSRALEEGCSILSMKWRFIEDLRK